MKKILITGCSGFIGSHLTDFYLKKKYQVIGVDNLMTGSIENVKHNLNNKNFIFIEHDIRKELNIDKKIDYILHFASPASPNDYLNFPIETMQIGSIGTENILNIGVKNNCRTVVASTSEVYGDPLVHPQNELYFGNVNPIGPRGVYDEAKRYLEALTMAYKKIKDLNIGIVRIFNTYGPRMRINDGRAIPNFINQAMKNNNFTIYGDGHQTRSFCYISDTVQGINKLLKSNYPNPINIGNPTEYSILELTNIIKRLLKSKSNSVFSKLPENDPKVRRPDISLAKKTLEWEPKVNLIDGLNSTIKYYKNLYNFKK